MLFLLLNVDMFALPSLLVICKVVTLQSPCLINLPYIVYGRAVSTFQALLFLSTLLCYHHILTSHGTPNFKQFI